MGDDLDLWMRERELADLRGQLVGIRVERTAGVVGVGGIATEAMDLVPGVVVERGDERVERVVRSVGADARNEHDHDLLAGLRDECRRLVGQLRGAQDGPGRTVRRRYPRRTVVPGGDERSGSDDPEGEDRDHGEGAERTQHRAMTRLGRSGEDGRRERYGGTGQVRVFATSAACRCAAYSSVSSSESSVTSPKRRARAQPMSWSASHGFFGSAEPWR